MIEIKHKTTGEVLHTIDGNTLAGANLRRVQRTEEGGLALMDFSHADFSHADLRGADLRSVVFTGAYFSYADLSGAFLSEAVLRNADLSHANLSGAILTKADLYNTSFIGGNLSRAFLNLANLERSDLSEANLSEAYLSEAELRNADFSGADLSKADFSQADLRQAKLRLAKFGTNRKAMFYCADLSEVNLSGADLSEVDLSRADLSQANLSDANLSQVSLSQANLVGANLSQANLVGANLSRAYLIRANLTGANLTGVKVGLTSFTECATLCQTVGLDKAVHWTRSYIDRIVLQSCIDNLPDVFLEGVGYTSKEISSLRALYTKNAPVFYSAFISHASQKPDSGFADRLRNDLRANNVPCWHFRYDLEMGDRWAAQIEGAIKEHDKLIVVCSEEGVFKEGVIKEIIRAIELEMKDGKQKLFPVRLDNFILGKEAQAKFDALPSHLKRTDWLSYMKEYQIGDFTKWKRHDTYQAQFDRLLHALKNPAGR